VPQRVVAVESHDLDHPHVYIGLRPIGFADPHHSVPLLRLAPAQPFYSAAVLCCVGDLVEDVVVWLPGPVHLGDDTETQITRQRGGSAANTATAAVRAGGRARFVGQVGDDDLGRRLTDHLAEEGVDLGVRRAGRSGSIVVLVDDRGERTMLTDRAACTHLAGADQAWLDGVEVLHLPAYSLLVEPLGRTCLDLARVARTRGIPVTVDPSSAALVEAYGVERFRSLLAELRPSVVFPNEAEAPLLGGLGDDVLVVEKRGPDPVRIGSLEVPVPPVSDVVDTTGAGDAFAAGFLVAWTAGKPVAEAAAAGNEVAAHVIRGPGGDAWVPA
jgi:sugar/nucleoside kinase (ribokinase family)